MVKFDEQDGHWKMSPVGQISQQGEPELWRRYSREQIPALFGFEFSTGAWNQGFVRQGSHMFLLVTLDKEDLEEDYGYQDYFVDPSTFHWQSQNRTTQDSGIGQSIKNHVQEGIAVHLFIRKEKKESGKASPFYNCGTVQFVSWEGNQPISVTWALDNEVPDAMYRVLTEKA